MTEPEPANVLVLNDSLEIIPTFFTKRLGRQILPTFITNLLTRLDQPEHLRWVSEQRTGDAVEKTSDDRFNERCDLFAESGSSMIIGTSRAFPQQINQRLNLLSSAIRPSSLPHQSHQCFKTSHIPFPPPDPTQSLSHSSTSAYPPRLDQSCPYLCSLGTPDLRVQGRRHHLHQLPLVSRVSDSRNAAYSHQAWAFALLLVSVV